MKYVLSMLSLLITLHLYAQPNNKKLNKLSQESLVDPTDISVDPSSTSIPVYFAVIRVNNKLFQVYPFNIGIYDKYNLEDNFRVVFPKNLFSAEQIVELLSQYDFELSIDKKSLVKRIGKKTQDSWDETTKLPKYITFKIERLYFK